MDILFIRQIVDDRRFRVFSHAVFLFSHDADPTFGNARQFDLQEAVAVTCADAFLLNLMQDAAQGTGNDLGTVDISGTGGGDLVWDAIVDLSVKLDEANVPTEGRFVVLAPALHGRLLKDNRFIAAGDVRGAETRASGFIGQVAGLDIFKSNNMPAVTDVAATAGAAIAGHRMATSFAEQIVSVEAFRMERRFADAVKGLHVYGAKVVRPTALATVEFDGTV